MKEEAAITTFTREKKKWIQLCLLHQNICSMPTTHLENNEACI